MALYQRGSQRPEVASIQTWLQGLGLYAGPIDGDFGGGTESAVKAFQGAKGLDADGKVDPLTWAALFDTVNAIAGAIQFDRPVFQAETRLVPWRSYTGTTAPTTHPGGFGGPCVSTSNFNNGRESRWQRLQA